MGFSSPLCGSHLRAAGGESVPVNVGARGRRRRGLQAVGQAGCNTHYDQEGFSGASEAAPALRCAPCPRSEYGRPLTVPVATTTGPLTLTGMRGGEAMGLDRQDLDVAGRDRR